VLVGLQPFLALYKGRLFVSAKGFLSVRGLPPPRGQALRVPSPRLTRGLGFKRLGNLKIVGLCRPIQRRGGVGEKGCLAACSGCWGQEYFVGC